VFQTGRRSSPRHPGGDLLLAARDQRAGRCDRATPAAGADDGRVERAAGTLGGNAGSALASSTFQAKTSAISGKRSVLRRQIATALPESPSVCARPWYRPRVEEVQASPMSYRSSTEYLFSWATVRYPCGPRLDHTRLGSQSVLRAIRQDIERCVRDPSRRFPQPNHVVLALSHHPVSWLADGKHVGCALHAHAHVHHLGPCSRAPHRGKEGSP
jgi:hypothetical protein